MIDLGRKWPPPEMAQPSLEGKPKARIDYPGFNVSNINLGIDEEDAGKVVEAKVKLKITRAGTEVRNDGTKNKKTEDYSFDILAIALDKKTFGDAVEKGVKNG